MKTTMTLTLSFLFVAAMIFMGPTGAMAQTCEGDGTNFVDLDGDGFNDNAPDHDGDGIPNGLDPDYIKNAQDGTGLQKGKLNRGTKANLQQSKLMTKSMKFNRQQSLSASMFQKRLGSLGEFGGNGTGICDGSGAGSAGTGICDGDGPHGRGGQGSN